MLKRFWEWLTERPIYIKGPDYQVHHIWVKGRDGRKRLVRIEGP